MPIDICQALTENRIDTVKAIVDKKIKELRSQNNEDAIIFTQFKEWLEEQYCIESVTITPGLFRTIPPVKEFNLILKPGINKENKQRIQISLFPDNYKMD